MAVWLWLCGDGGEDDDKENYNDVDAAVPSAVGTDDNDYDGDDDNDDVDVCKRRTNNGKDFFFAYLQPLFLSSYWGGIESNLMNSQISRVALIFNFVRRRYLYCYSG